MALDEREASHVALMDVCLAGVFVGRGEKIPDDLYEAWRRRLTTLGLKHDEAMALGMPESGR